MNEAQSRHWFFFARERSVSILSAPDSSLRNARRAKGSRTKLFLGGIFFLSVSPPVFQELLCQSFLAGAAKGLCRICGYRDNPRCVTLHYPFQWSVWTDVKLPPNT
jgi:hypothetical protein